MKYLIKLGLVIATTASLAVVALAGPVTGIWHGNIRFDASKLPNEANPNHKKLQMAGIQAQQKVKMTLEIKGDHTYSLIVSGGPKGASTKVGKWDQKGNLVTLTPIEAGKPGAARSFTLSSDSKSFAFTQGPVTMSFYK